MEQEEFFPCNLKLEERPKSVKNNGANLLTTDGLICQQLINYNDHCSKVYVDILKK